jgi:hypothetical protein
MKTRYYALLLMGVLLAAASIGNAANIEHHMYWGAAAKDEIWSEFDSSFANSLNFGWPVNDSIQLLTDKFYLIGLTLPDAMLPTQQSASREIISGLWSARVAVESVAGCLGYMLGVLPIYVDSMANVEVQTPDYLQWCAAERQLPENVGDGLLRQKPELVALREVPHLRRYGSLHAGCLRVRVPTVAIRIWFRARCT